MDNASKAPWPKLKNLVKTLGLAAGKSFIVGQALITVGAFLFVTITAVTLATAAAALFE